MDAVNGREGVNDFLSAQMHDAFERSERAMKPLSWQLLCGGADPASVPLVRLRAELGLWRPMYPELHSLRLLRLAQGLPECPPALDTTSADVAHVLGVIPPAYCAFLRAAFDAAYPGTRDRGGVNEVAADSIDALPDHQLDLSTDRLVALIGADAVNAVLALPSRIGDCGPLSIREIFVRRYSCAPSRPWLPFHGDRARTTANISLSDPESHTGGCLLAAIDGAIVAIPRAEGQATVHNSALLHGVSKLTSGSRYSLLIFFCSSERK